MVLEHAGVCSPAETAASECGAQEGMEGAILMHLTGICEPSALRHAFMGRL